MKIVMKQFILKIKTKKYHHLNLLYSKAIIYTDSQNCLHLCKSHI